MTLAVICGVLITSIICTIFCFSVIGSVASFGTARPSVPKDAVLKIDMSRLSITEQTAESGGIVSIGTSISIDTPEQLGLLDAAEALETAAQDPCIKYAFLKVDGTSAGISTLREFRKSLENFRAAGKAVIAYTESPSTGSYYLASAADKVYMSPHLGTSSYITGISARLTFLKDLLDKLGVNVQLIRHGKYKSAGEMFSRNSASPENMDQTRSMVNSLWETLSGEIAESRSISVEELNAAIDGLRLVGPEDFLECRLADELLTREELRHKLADLAVVEDFKDVRMIGLKDYWLARASKKTVKDKIAIIYADGEIIDGDAVQEVAGDRFAREIAKVRADSSVKAVVLRVNSPGGSVLASEKIKAELDLLKADKPIVASYGDYAASGGYWISNNADYIFSNPTTLTGSIGVFAMVPDFSKTIKDVAHVTVTPVNSNEHGDMFSLTRPFDEREYEFMKSSIERVYDKFVSMVSAGRSMEPAEVDEIAQGRVWTGSQALEIGLVDELGTLQDAIAYAARVAGNEDLSAWKIVGYPAPETPFEQILSQISGGREDEDVILAGLKNLAEPKTVARLPYEISFR